jgi:hypothetical protein
MAIGGTSKILSFYHEPTQFAFIIFTHGENSEMYIQAIATAQKLFIRHKQKLEYLKSDSLPTMMSKEVEIAMTNLEINLEFSPPHHHEGVGGVEKFNGTLSNAIAVMFAGAPYVPRPLYTYAAVLALILFNLRLSRNTKITRNEAFTNIKPDWNKHPAAAFGAPFLINIIRDNLTWKFDLRAREAMYLCPDMRSSFAQIFYVPESRSIVRSRDFHPLKVAPISWNLIKPEKELRIADQNDNTKLWLSLQDGIIYWNDKITSSELSLPPEITAEELESPPNFPFSTSNYEKSSAGPSVKPTSDNHLQIDSDSSKNFKPLGNPHFNRFEGVTRSTSKSNDIIPGLHNINVQSNNLIQFNTSETNNVDSNPFVSDDSNLFIYNKPCILPNSTNNVMNEFENKALQIECSNPTSIRLINSGPNNQSINVESEHLNANSWNTQNNIENHPNYSNFSRPNNNSQSELYFPCIRDIQISRTSNSDARNSSFEATTLLSHSIPIVTESVTTRFPEDVSEQKRANHLNPVPEIMKQVFFNCIESNSENSYNTQSLEDGKNYTELDPAPDMFCYDAYSPDSDNNQLTCHTYHNRQAQSLLKMNTELADNGDKIQIILIPWPMITVHQNCMFRVYGAYNSIVLVIWMPETARSKQLTLTLYCH